MKRYVFICKIAGKIIIALALPAVLFMSCFESPLTPVGPSFDTQLAIPVLDRTYLSTRIIDDPANIGYNPDGTFSYKDTYALDEKSLEPLTALPEPDSEKTTLGRFKIDTVDIPKMCYATNLFGGTLPPIIPDTTFTTGTDHIVKTYQFIFIRIYKGVLILTVTNNLPVPVDFPLPINLRNDEPGDNSQLASFRIQGTLLQGESRQVRDTIDGDLAYGHLAIDPFQIHTAGSGGSPVTFNPMACISFGFQAPPILADSAEAVIPNQVIVSDSNSTFVVDDSLTIRDARFKKGRLAVEITNRISLSTEIHVQVEELFNMATGRKFMFDTTFPGSGKKEIIVPVKDYRITSNQTMLGTRLHYFAGITVVNSFGNMQRVSKNDFIQVKITPLDTLYAESITGNFPTRYVDIYQGAESNLNVKDSSDIGGSVLFKDIKLKVRLPVTGTSTSPPPVDYKNLTLIAKNTALGKIDSIMMPDGSINLAQTDTIDFTTAAGFDNFTRSLQSDFPHLPDSFFVRGYLEVNPDFVHHTDAQYTISENSGIAPLVDIEIPSVLSVANGMIRDTTIKEEKADDDVARSVNGGTLSLSFKNGIPVQMVSTVGFRKWNDSTRRSQTVYTTPVLGPIAAAHTGSDSSAIDSVDSNIKVYLSGDEFRKINDADSAFVSLILNTSDGSTNGVMVKLRSTDAIRVKASTIVRLTVNKQ